MCGLFPLSALVDDSAKPFGCRRVVSHLPPWVFPQNPPQRPAKVISWYGLTASLFVSCCCCRSRPPLARTVDALPQLHGPKSSGSSTPQHFQYPCGGAAAGCRAISDNVASIGSPREHGDLYTQHFFRPACGSSCGWQVRIGI